MLSDVLFEAIQSIKQYQNDYPEIYDSKVEIINKLVADMQELQDHYDKPPLSTEQLDAIERARALDEAKMPCAFDVVMHSILGSKMTVLIEKHISDSECDTDKIEGWSGEELEAVRQSLEALQAKLNRPVMN